jgi:hypothetical protein
MRLSVHLDEANYNIDIPAAMLSGEADEFFRQMDSDMDNGWQMSMDFVESPNQLQRCQIAADRLHTAIAAENQTLAQLMAAYIVMHIPGVTAVEINDTGEMQDIEFVQSDAPVEAPAAAASQPGAMNKLQAMEQAGKDVSKVYKQGRNYRFAMYDHSESRWIESPPFSDEQQASEARNKTFEKYYRQLCGEG